MASRACLDFKTNPQLVKPEKEVDVYKPRNDTIVMGLGCLQAFYRLPLADFVTSMHTPSTELGASLCLIYTRAPQDTDPLSPIWKFFLAGCPRQRYLG